MDPGQEAYRDDSYSRSGILPEPSSVLPDLSTVEEHTDHTENCTAVIKRRKEGTLTTDDCGTSRKGMN